MITYYLALVSLLGSDDFRTRELAMETLRNENAIPAVLLSLDDKDPEIVRRCEILIAYHKNLWVAYHLERLKVGGVYPYIDMFPAKIHWQPYLHRTRNIMGKVPKWEEYRLATELYLREHLEGGTDPATLQSIIQETALNELRWLIRHKYILRSINE